MRYETERELRRAVERRLSSPIDDDQWEGLKPDVDEFGPFDDHDVAEILAGIPRKPRKPRDDTSWRLALAMREASMPYNPARFRHLAEDIRRHYGLAAPMPAEELRNALMGLGAEEALQEGSRVLLIPYVEPVDGVSNVYCVRYLNVPEDVEIVGEGRQIVFTHPRVYDLGLAANELSWFLGCHPALVLALILCDIDIGHVTCLVYPRGITGNISDAARVTIDVSSPYVPPGEVKMAYSSARNAVIKRNRLSKGKWVRSRPLSTRTTRLLEYVSSHPEVGWKERLRAWNKLHPEWKYKDVNSMRTTYNRVNKHPNKPRPAG